MASLIVLITDYIFVDLISLTPFQTGLIFVINGLTYAATTPVWAFLCGKKVNKKISKLLSQAISVPNR